MNIKDDFFVCSHGSHTQDAAQTERVHSPLPGERDKVGGEL